MQQANQRIVACLSALLAIEEIARRPLRTATPYLSDLKHRTRELFDAVKAVTAIPDSDYESFRKARLQRGPIRLMGRKDPCAHDLALALAGLVLKALNQTPADDPHAVYRQLDAKGLNYADLQDLWVEVEWEAEAAGLVDGGDPQDQTHRIKGVSAQDAAERIRPNDPEGQGNLVKSWRNSTDPKFPRPIGKAPEHKQMNLYKPAEILDFLKKVEGKAVDKERHLSAHFHKVERYPRPETQSLSPF